ncbi:MAG TPA: tetratricopeptide repeat protein, partial [Bryobacteraceae bacterium]
NERLTRFLTFAVEQHIDGKAGEIKESVIAIEVFGRGADHDPKQDSIVRTEASRLRARLNEYYLGDGKNDALIIQLPKGGYAPVFRQIAPEQVAAPLASTSTAAPRNYRWLSVALAGVAVAVGALAWWWFQSAKAPVSIAVLPLTNLSQDSGDDYFADGLTAEIIGNLSEIDGLAVRSLTSSFVFKGKPQNVREAGKQLQADYIVEGSVLRERQKLRINARLVRVRDDFPIWSAWYDRELADVLAIQDEISRGIVNNLRLKLGNGRRRYEISSEVYDSYLRARALTVERGASGINRSIGLLEDVVAKDPSFAPAYADLAAAYVYRSGVFQFNISNEMLKMRAAAEKATRLDPLLPQAYYAQAMVYARQAKWEQSEKSFRRAIEMAPSRSESHADFANNLLLPLGRIEEAVREARAATKVDPLSSESHYRLANVLISAGRYDEAVTNCAMMAADSPEKSWCLGRARMGQARIDEAIQILEAAMNRGVEPGSQVRGELGYAYARAGRRDQAEQFAAATPSVNPFNKALIYAGLGDKDRTLAALDLAAASGPFRIGRALTYPEFNLLKGDPRVKALRTKVGLPE